MSHNERKIMIKKLKQINFESIKTPTTVEEFRRDTLDTLNQLDAKEKFAIALTA